MQNLIETLQKTYSHIGMRLPNKAFDRLFVTFEEFWEKILQYFLEDYLYANIFDRNFRICYFLLESKIYMANSCEIT